MLAMTPQGWTAPGGVLAVGQQDANYPVLQNSGVVAPIQVAANENIRCADIRHLLPEVFCQRTDGLTHGCVKLIAVLDFWILDVNAVVRALLVDFTLLNLQNGL